jgi:hypothetical protein
LIVAGDLFCSKYGPVQDVRIPYQQRRMFGFVTFVYPETVKLILSKGNPHFVCDARVLVKPYKEKGKVLDRFRHAWPIAHFPLLCFRGQLQGEKMHFLFTINFCLIAGTCSNRTVACSPAA